jgi:hypothetical protein
MILNSAPSIAIDHPSVSVSLPKKEEFALNGNISCIGDTPPIGIKDLNIKKGVINPLFSFISNINKVETSLANKKNKFFSSSFSLRQRNKI